MLARRQFVDWDARRGEWFRRDGTSAAWRVRVAVFDVLQMGEDIVEGVERFHRGGHELVDEVAGGAVLGKRVGEVGLGDREGDALQERGDGLVRFLA